MKPHEVQEKLGLTRIRDRNWYVQPSCATSGDGLFQGLQWLSSNHRSWCMAWEMDNCFHNNWIINILLPYGHPEWNSEHFVHRVNSVRLFFIIKYFVWSLKFLDCHYCCVYYFEKSVSFLSCVATMLKMHPHD